jgi:serine/threonine-protein kinase
LFSLGALFYEMLAQRAPFEGGTPQAITENILRGAPRPPSEFNPHVPRALDTIILSMLAANPAHRMAGAPVLLRELQRLQEALGLDLGANAPGEEPTAGARPAQAEPALRTPDPIDLQDREPRFEMHGDPVFDREPFDVHRAMMQRESAQRPSRLRPTMFAALGLALAVLGVALAGSMGLTELPRLADLTRLAGLLPIGSERPIAASAVEEAPATEPAASHATAPAPAVEEIKQVLTTPDSPEVSPPLTTPEAIPPTPPAAEPGPLAQAEPPVAPAPEQPASVVTPPAQERPRAIRASTQAPRPQRNETARVIVSVSPRGELYIDGKHQGTTPPITTFNLTPGLHRIEVRHGSRKPYLTYMTVQAGEVRRIRHDFDARPIRPPR